MGVPKGFISKLTLLHTGAFQGPIKVVGRFLMILEHLFDVIHCDKSLFGEPSKKPLASFSLSS